jgi:hypothetical protein
MWLQPRLARLRVSISPSQPGLPLRRPLTAEHPCDRHYGDEVISMSDLFDMEKFRNSVSHSVVCTDPFAPYIPPDQ